MPISIDDRLAVKSSNYREGQSAEPSPPSAADLTPFDLALRYEFPARGRERERGKGSSYFPSQNGEVK
jgi:hypothetical protein